MPLQHVKVWASDSDVFIERRRGNRWRVGFGIEGQFFQGLPLGYRFDKQDAPFKRGVSDGSHPFVRESGFDWARKSYEMKEAEMVFVILYSRDPFDVSPNHLPIGADDNTRLHFSERLFGFIAALNRGRNKRQDKYENDDRISLRSALATLDDGWRCNSAEARHNQKDRERHQETN